MGDGLARAGELLELHAAQILEYDCQGLIMPTQHAELAARASQYGLRCDGSMRKLLRGVLAMAREYHRVISEREAEQERQEALGVLDAWK